MLTGVFGFSTNYLRRYLGAKVSVYLQHDLRQAIHRHLYELDFSRHDELSVGDIMSRSTGDLTLIQAFFFSVPMLVANMTLLVVAIVVMFVLSPLLSLVVVVFVPVFAFFAIRFRDRVFPASWNDQRLSGAVAGVVDEAVTGVRVVKAFAQEQREFDRLTEQAHELYQSRMRTARYNARYSSTLQALPMLAQLGVLALGGWLALARPHHARRVPRLRQLPRADHHAGAPRLQPAGHHAAGARRRRAGLRAARPGSPRHRRAGRPAGRRPARRHRARPRRLRPPGRPADACTTSRCGSGPASGSGSSARRARASRRFAYLIARFYDPTSGTVRLDGTDVRELTLESLRSTVNVVFEESFLFSTTIRENIAFGRPGATDADIEAAARVAAAHEFILELRDGYDTVVGERGFTLSGGQRQRIALARAALANPKVLVLDDATSAIDAHTEERIHAALADELGSRTTVLIAHRSSTLRLADRVFVLDGGRIVAEGTNAELWHTSRAVPRAAARARAAAGPRRRRSSTRSTPTPGRRAARTTTATVRTTSSWRRSCRAWPPAAAATRSA